MRNLPLVFIFLNLLSCSEPRMLKKNDSNNPKPNPKPDNYIHNDKIPDGKKIYIQIPFPKKFKNNPHGEDYNKFIKQLEAFYNSKRNEINEALKNDPIGTLKQILPRSNNQAIDAIYSKALIGDSRDPSTENILKEMFGSYDQDNDEKKSRRDKFIKWLKQENILPYSGFSEYLFPENKENAAQFWCDVDLRKHISEPSPKILRKIQTDIKDFKSGIYCTVICPYCGHTAYNYTNKQLNHKHHFLNYVVKLIDLQKMRIRCYNKKCLAFTDPNQKKKSQNYQKIIIQENGMCIILLKDVKVNIQIEGTDGAHYFEEEKVQGIKYLNLQGLLDNPMNTTETINKNIAKYTLEGINVTITNVSK